jgi:hypothetical protein
VGSPATTISRKVVNLGLEALVAIVVVIVFAFLANAIGNSLVSLLAGVAIGARRTLLTASRAADAVAFVAFIAAQWFVYAQFVVPEGMVGLSLGLILMAGTFAIGAISTSAVMQVYRPGAVDEVSQSR